MPGARILWWSSQNAWGKYYSVGLMTKGNPQLYNSEFSALLSMKVVDFKTGRVGKCWKEVTQEIVREALFVLSELRL